MSDEAFKPRYKLFKVNSLKKGLSFQSLETNEEMENNADNFLFEIVQKEGDFHNFVFNIKVGKERNKNGGFCIEHPPNHIIVLKEKYQRIDIINSISSDLVYKLGQKSFGILVLNKPKEVIKLRERQLDWLELQYQALNLDSFLRKNLAEKLLSSLDESLESEI